MDTIPFIKMHGLGNDFVVVDARERAFQPTPAQARAIGDRRRGVGFDQLLIIEPSRTGGGVFMRILNPDGSESSACGNGTRCIADLVMRQAGTDSTTVETLTGPLACRRETDGRITVAMGPIHTGWRDIPLATESDTLHLDIAAGPLSDPVAVNVGNPHAVFFIDNDPDSIDLAGLGPGLETHPLFPERANIGVARVTAPNAIKLRVWERGAGLTLACGSGACAALAAAHRRGLTGRQATVTLPGGDLDIDWDADGTVWMTGPVATAFSGSLDPARLAS